MILTTVLLVGAVGWVAGQAVGPEIPVWVDSDLSHMPSVAFDIIHEEFLVVWYNEQGPNVWDVYARRVKLDGSLSTWFAVVSGANQKHFNPVVACNVLRQEYLVAWVYEFSTSDHDIWGSLVAWNGSAVGAPFVINQDPEKQDLPAVAFNPNADEYLVAYTNRWTTGYFDVAAQRVAGDGSLESWANVATGTTTSRLTPAVAFHPGLDQYLIAYTYQEPTFFSKQIYGKTAASDLSGVSVAPEIIIQDGVAEAWSPAVAAAGEGYITQFTAYPYPDIKPYARRLEVDGSPLGPASGFPIGSASDVLYSDWTRSNAVAYAEAVGYVAVWNEGMSLSNGDVHARVVSPVADTPLSQEIVVAASARDEYEVAIACTPWGTCLVAYQSDENIVARLIQLHIFGDGFESGDTSFWSTVAP